MGLAKSALRVVACALRDASSAPRATPFALRDASCALRCTPCALRVASSALRCTPCALRVASSALRAATRRAHTTASAPVDAVFGLPFAARLVSIRRSAPCRTAHAGDGLTKPPVAAPAPTREEIGRRESADGNRYSDDCTREVGSSGRFSPTGWPFIAGREASEANATPGQVEIERSRLQVCSCNSVNAPPTSRPSACVAINTPPTGGGGLCPSPPAMDDQAAGLSMGVYTQSDVQINTQAATVVTPHGHEGARADRSGYAIVAHAGEASPAPPQGLRGRSAHAKRK